MVHYVGKFMQPNGDLLGGAKFPPHVSRLMFSHFTQFIYVKQNHKSPIGHGLAMMFKLTADLKTKLLASTNNRRSSCPLQLFKLQADLSYVVSF